MRVLSFCDPRAKWLCDEKEFLWKGRSRTCKNGEWTWVVWWDKKKRGGWLHEISSEERKWDFWKKKQKKQNSLLSKLIVKIKAITINFNIL